MIMRFKHTEYNIIERDLFVDYGYERWHTISKDTYSFSSSEFRFVVTEGQDILQDNNVSTAEVVLTEPVRSVSGFLEFIGDAYLGSYSALEPFTLAIWQ